MNEFKGSFDYKTTEGLIEHLREHAARTAGGGPSDSAYDPETLCLEQDAARELERLLRIERLYGPMTVDQRFLLHLVDIVWGDAMEDGHVPSTEYALKLIKRARDTFDAID